VNMYGLVHNILVDEEVPCNKIGSDKCTGTRVSRKLEVQIVVRVYELSPDFC